MAEITRPSGVRIDIGESFRIQESEPIARRGAPKGLPRRPVPLPAAGSPQQGSDELLAALAKLDLEIVDVVQLEPTTEGTPLPGRRRAAETPLPSSATTTLSIDLPQDDNAVVLIEQDGVYSWNLPESVPVREGAGQPRRAAPGTQKTLRFRVEVHAQPPTGPATRTGLLKHLVFNRLKAYVLKFAAKAIVQHGVEYLERDSREQLLLVDSLDPAAWRGADDPGVVALPTGRPPRILVLIHGTFSSTIGTFGGLTATPWGQEFIRAAQSHYDAVLGFDHFTLKRDPDANAQALLAQLQRIAWPAAPAIDVIAYSRGGLVLRSLMDLLPTASKPDLRIQRAVFVACTNDGTTLANPDNWRTLIDLYTNLAVAACRIMQMMPHALGVAVIMKELIQGVSSLVKYMATEAEDVPGLAAMQPGSAFLGKLHHAGSAPLSQTLNYVITSEFAPVITGAQAEPKELPARLLAAIAGGLISQLMHEGNDLVVNASSMATLERTALELVHDRFDFGQTAKVYHTTYFLRPEVVNALVRWLGLAAPEQIAPPQPEHRVFRGVSIAGGPSSKPLPPPRFSNAFRLDLPASVDGRIVVTPASAPVGELIESVRDTLPSYVVVRRAWEGQTLHYALPAEEVLAKAAGVAGNVTVSNALQLHEWGKSPETSVSDAFANPDGLAVVLSHDRVVGVAAPAMGGGDDLVELANACVRPKDEASALAAARAMPVFSTSGTSATATLFLRAEMDESVTAGKATSIDVTLSREAMAGPVGPTAGESSGEAELKRKVAVQVIPRAEFAVIGQDRYEIEIPESNAPWTGSFDVKATHSGKGELWVVLSQGQAALTTVVLSPEVVEKQTHAGQITAWSSGKEQTVPAPAVDQLLIIEQRNGNEIKLWFQLQSTSLDLFHCYESKPIVGDRDSYVKNLYGQVENRWVSSKNDMDDFTQELRELGADLFTELFPPELQTLLWSAADKLKSVLVISTEPFIPWELLHLKEVGKALGKDLRFLGQMGVVRWLHQAGYPPMRISVREGRARFVIPDYPTPDYTLPELQNERQFLEKEFHAKPIDPHPSDVRRALQNPEMLDLLHFASHGEADLDNLADARIMLEGRIEGTNYVPEYLSALAVEHNATLKQADGNRPIVFVNACQLARAGYKLSGLGGFAQAFLSAGAGVFAGALWNLGDHAASSFAQRFYTELHAGANLSQATMRARESARADGDASWLAYAVYGHPLAVVKWLPGS